MDDFFSVIIKLFEAMLEFIFECFQVVISGISKRKKEYNASFISAGTLLSKRDSGFCLTGRRNLSTKLSFQNALITGGTGVGKSSVVLIPSLYTMQGSFIIHDPSSELYAKSAGYLRQRGYEIKVLNFANPAVSSGYNPLIRAKTSSDVQKVASLLVETSLGGKTKDPFWNTQAVSLLTFLISILKTQEPEYQNLYNVRHLLNQLGGNPSGIDSLFSRYADDVLFSEYKSFIAYDDKVVNGIIATAKAAVQIFSDESVAKVTSFDSINMQDFRSRPTALYIQNSVADQKYYSALTSLFFEQFFAFILGRFPQEGEQDIFFLIDEASSLNMPTLPLAVANVRKHRAGIMLLVQDFAQLVHHHGKYDADAIRANCFAKMYFTGQSLETTKELEQTLGRYEFLDDKKQKVVRPLMTNDEIRTMQVNRAILICGNNPPIMARLKPYYDNREYRSYSELPLPLVNTETKNISPALLPLLSVHFKEDAA
jgi:type IV secretion system protein VirD4